MQRFIFRVDKPEYHDAGARSIIELRGAAGNNNLYIQKSKLEIFVGAIATHEAVSVSGPTGSGKTALIEALTRVPENFLPVCEALSLPPKPVLCYPVEMNQFETGAEVYRVRSLASGNTFYEDSPLFKALEEAQPLKEKNYIVIWHRELGRCQAGIQGALVNIITRGDIIHPDGRRYASEGISFVADSNYQDMDDGTYTLCVFDDALRRRYSVNLTLEYLPASTEILILRHLLEREGASTDDETLSCLVKLGARIREEKRNGRLQSVPPPTIYGYLAVLRLSALLPNYELKDIGENTLLGSASVEDRRLFPALYHDVFGSDAANDADISIGSDLL
ncbi:MAG: hypothetical protein KFH87_03970 [Bacteroidetes bacterium]|nr:hypothetical protein [Bacteroidota bacterium]